MKYRVLTKCTLIFVVLAGFGAGKLYGASVPKSAKPWPKATVTYHLEQISNDLNRIGIPKVLEW